MGIKLNYGCGETPLKGYINIDSSKNALTKPDLVCDIIQAPLPYKDNSIEEISFIHAIEHIQRLHWYKVFTEFHRVLEHEGRLIIAYPEFERCAKNFIENYKGMRDYWRMTLYGRQQHIGDYHVVPMRTEEVITYLQDVGFKNIKYVPEDPDVWNTFLVCNKGIKPLNREQLYRKELFGVSNEEVTI